MQALRGQNDASGWYFIEELKISKLYFNVTIQMSSNIINAADQLVGSNSDGQSSAGLFGHIMKSSGFQLINVNNVAIEYDVRSPPSQVVLDNVPSDHPQNWLCCIANER